MAPSAKKKPAERSARVRYALLVLGMHRSGTSALSGVLANLGATPPKSPMPANEFNPKGYWESQPLAVLNDLILQSAGSRWSDWGRFNSDWSDSPVAAGFKRRLEDGIASEYGDSQLFVIKDPRISRFLPIWLSALQELNVSPKVVIPSRHPDEVARSLAKRDQFGEGKSQLLWLRHVLDSEFASRGLQRTFVRYEDLLADWQSQVRKVGEELGITWPRWSADTEVAIGDFLSGELRHHRANGTAGRESGPLRQWAVRVHEIIDGFARGQPEDAGAFSVLDQIRIQFDLTAGIYGPVVREHELIAEKECLRIKSALSSEIEGARNRAAENRAALTEMERRALRAESDAKGRAGRLLVLQGEHDKLASSIVEQSERYVRREAELQAKLAVLQNEASTQAAEQLGRLQSQLVALQNEIAIRSEHIGRHQLVEAGLKKKIEELESELAAVQASWKDDRASLALREQENVKVNASLSERFRELAAFANAMEALRQDRTTLRADFSRLQQDLARNKSQLEETKNERENLVKHNLQLERANVTLSESEASFQREVELLKRELNTAKQSMDRQFAALASEKRSVEEKLDTVLHSKTWRAGRPVRFLWRVLTGAGWRRQVVSISDIERIRAAGVFDDAWYLAQYRDVAESGMDPAYHYLVHGHAEGRDPSPEFSTSAYLRSHPEISAKKQNALLYFLDHEADR